MPYEDDTPTSYSVRMMRKLKRRSYISPRYSRIGMKARFKWELDKARTQRLRMAVTTNNVELVERLLGCGSDPNESDEHKRSLLHLAACQGYLDIVKLLLSRGADPNNRDSLGDSIKIYFLIKTIFILYFFQVIHLYIWLCVRIMYLL